MTMNDEIIVEDIPKNTSKTVRRFISYIFLEKKKLLIIAFATVLSSLTLAAMPITMGMGIDRLIEAIQTYDPNIGVFSTIITSLGYPITLMIITFSSSCLLAYLQQYLVASVGEHITLKLRKEISSKLNRLPLRYFDVHQPGEIMSRITNELTTMLSLTS